MKNISSSADAAVMEAENRTLIAEEDAHARVISAEQAAEAQVEAAAQAADARVKAAEQDAHAQVKAAAQAADARVRAAEQDAHARVKAAAQAGEARALTGEARALTAEEQVVIVTEAADAKVEASEAKAMKAKHHATVTIQAERSVSSHNLASAKKQHKRHVARQIEDDKVLVAQVTEGKAVKKKAAAAFKKVATYEQSVLRAKRNANHMTESYDFLKDELEHVRENSTKQVQDLQDKLNTERFVTAQLKSKVRELDHDCTEAMEELVVSIRKMIFVTTISPSPSHLVPLTFIWKSPLGLFFLAKLPRWPGQAEAVYNGVTGLLTLSLRCSATGLRRNLYQLTFWRSAVSSPRTTISLSRCPVSILYETAVVF